MEITTSQYKQFSNLVYHECGINLHDGKQQLLKARLAKRLRKTGIHSAGAYLKVLENDDQQRNWIYTTAAQAVKEYLTSV